MLRHALLLALVACKLLVCLVHADGEWITGRATFYDDNTQGSCRYGTNIPAYYGAWPDGQAGFPACGECYEVACVDRSFRDGYGKTLERTTACLGDESQTVTVKIVDSCPCIHENFYSNQRWCCGDMRHIDLGRAAFAKIAPEHWGVVGAKWRKVSCPDSMATATATAETKTPAPEPEPEVEAPTLEPETDVKTTTPETKVDTTDYIPTPTPAPAPTPKPTPKAPKKKKSSSKSSGSLFNNDDFFSDNKSEKSGKWRIRWPKWFDDL